MYNSTISQDAEIQRRDILQGDDKKFIFGSILRSAYKSCKDDMGAISNFKSLVQYANGDYIHCNTSWSDVDHVLLHIIEAFCVHFIF